MSVVVGQNVMGYFYDDFWKPAVCGRSISITTETEIIETSITDSGVFRTYEPTANTWTATIDGVCYLQITNSATLPDIRSWQLAQRKMLFRYQRTDTENNVYLDEGIAIITSVTDTGDMDGVNTFSVTLKGTGPLTQIFTPTPVDPAGKVKRLEYTGVGGETSFTNALLIGKDVIAAHKDGIGAAKKITSGTPVNKEFRHISASGQVLFGTPYNTDEESYVLYQD